MARSKEDIQAQLAAYVDGDLDEAGRAEIEKHLAGSPQHRQLMIELTTQRELVQSLPRVNSPADFGEALQGQLERGALLNDIGETPDEAPLRISRMPQLMAAAAILLLAFGLGTILYFVLARTTTNSTIALAPHVTSGPVALSYPPSDEKQFAIAPTTAPGDTKVDALEQAGRTGMADADARKDVYATTLSSTPPVVAGGGVDATDVLAARNLLLGEKGSAIPAPNVAPPAALPATGPVLAQLPATPPVVANAGPQVDETASAANAVRPNAFCLVIETSNLSATNAKIAQFVDDNKIADSAADETASTLKKEVRKTAAESDDGIAEPALRNATSNQQSQQIAAAADKQKLIVPGAPAEGAAPAPGAEAVAAKPAGPGRVSAGAGQGAPGSIGIAGTPGDAPMGLSPSKTRDTVTNGSATDNKTFAGAAHSTVSGGMQLPADQLPPAAADVAPLVIAQAQKDEHFAQGSTTAPAVEAVPPAGMPVVAASQPIDLADRTRAKEQLEVAKANVQSREAGEKQASPRMLQMNREQAKALEAILSSEPGQRAELVALDDHITRDASGIAAGVRRALDAAPRQAKMPELQGAGGPAATTQEADAVTFDPSRAATQPATTQPALPGVQTVQVLVLINAPATQPTTVPTTQGADPILTK